MAAARGSGRCSRRPCPTAPSAAASAPIAAWSARAGSASAACARTATAALVDRVYGAAVAVGHATRSRRSRSSTSPRAALAYSIATARLPLPLRLLPELGDRPGTAARRAACRRTRCSPDRVVAERWTRVRARSPTPTSSRPSSSSTPWRRRAWRATAGLLNLFITDGYADARGDRPARPGPRCRQRRPQVVRRRASTGGICGARLAHVLEALVGDRRAGIWLEVTTLLIPGVNDDPAELRDADRAGSSTHLGPETPWHVSRFFPAYRMPDRPPTPLGHAPPRRGDRPGGRPAPRLRRQRARAGDRGHALRRLRRPPPGRRGYRVAAPPGRRRDLPDLRTRPGGRGAERASGARTGARAAESTGPGPRIGGGAVIGAPRRPAVAGSFYPAEPPSWPTLVDGAPRRGLASRRRVAARPGPASPASSSRMPGWSTRAASPRRLAALGRARRQRTDHDRPARHQPQRAAGSTASASGTPAPGGRRSASRRRRGPGRRDRRRSARRSRSTAQAHQTEHSLEVQLPFLRRPLPGARIVPLAGRGRDGERTPSRPASGWARSSRRDARPAPASSSRSARTWPTTRRRRPRPGHRGRCAPAILALDPAAPRPPRGGRRPRSGLPGRRLRDVRDRADACSASRRSGRWASSAGSGSPRRPRPTPAARRSGRSATWRSPSRAERRPRRRRSALGQAVFVPAASNVIARWSAAARISLGMATGPPRAMALIAALAASSTTPPVRTASSGVRWKTSTPWLARSTAGTPGRTAARMLATACSEPRGA